MKKFIKISFVFLLMIVVLVYLIGFYIFSNYFYPKTYVNGKNLGLTKITDLKKNYELKNINLTIISKEGKDVINPVDFKFSDKLNSRAEVKQVPISWFVSMFFEHRYDTEHSFNYDEDEFNKIYDNLKFVKAEKIPSQDAYIAYENNKFLIKKEILGNELIVKDIKSNILKSFESGSNILDLEKEDLYIKPKIYSDSPILEKELSQKNKLANLKVTYNFSDRKEILEGDKLVDLYTSDINGDLYPNRDKIKAYIYYLSDKYDTFKSDRIFYATGKGYVSVKGGIYGWSTDIEKSTDELLKILESKESKEIEPIYKLTAKNRGLNDIGNTYIEIDLARQTMWLYKEGNLIVSTPIVSGNVSKGFATPTGTGKIWSREKNRYLTGQDYNSLVSYWMPFNWSGCGLHDSSWRSDYGKDIYLQHGSHGCINTPPDIMPLIFDNALNGTAVVVYDSNVDKVNM